MDKDWTLEPSGGFPQRPRSRGTRRWTCARACALCLLTTFSGTLPAFAQNAGGAPPPNTVSVTFAPAPALAFPNPTDSNSPAVWDGTDFYLFNSLGGSPRRAMGTRLEDATDTDPNGSSSSYTNEVGAGRWLESVIRDEVTGELYGWYHEELFTSCPQGLRYWPQIGAAISDDDGATWDDLGIVLSPRVGTVTCDTEHPVTNGGIGDFSVILDRNTDAADHYLYFIFSSYGGDLVEQGISFARMLWNDRDQPLDPSSGESRAFKWDGTTWASPGIGGYSAAILHDSRQVSWTSLQNNGYWGPSVHWNTGLKRFVVLMSRSQGGDYNTEGIYMTYTNTLDDPTSWVLPKMIISAGQGWYPQVIGNADISGTDQLAGIQARYFNQGRSTSLIVFVDDAPANQRRRHRPQ